MGVGQRQGHLPDQNGGLAARQWSILDSIGEAASFDVGHREVMPAGVFTDFVDGHDSRVVELGGQLCLLVEALDVLLRRHLAGQDRLQGDHAVQAVLPRQVNRAHAAAGELRMSE